MQTSPMSKCKLLLLQGPLGLSGASGYPGGPGMKVGIYIQCCTVYMLSELYIKYLYAKHAFIFIQ